MPVTLVGREGHFHGKSLYYIARNLKNLGKGRVVIRTAFSNRYPEPSYYKLTEVRPEMNAKGYFKGVAYGEKVFRGRNFGICKIESGHKPDWRLIPKDQEDEICQPFQRDVVTVVPSKQKIPPLLELILKDELLSENMPVDESTFLCKTKIQKKDGKFRNAVLDDES